MATLSRKLNFPPELLLIIKESIAEWDLRTHVCFYLSSPRVAALYNSGNHPDRFWELACWNNGLSATVVEDDDEDAMIDVSSESGAQVMPSWKDVAIDCITRDGFCPHPQCGEALLEYNRECMHKVAGVVEALEPIQMLDDQSSAYPSFRAHRLFGHIEFRRDQDFFHSFPVELDAHLRVPGAPPRRLDSPKRLWHSEDHYPGLYLADHPVVTRSFATFPPVLNIMLLYLLQQDLPRGTMERVTPITVLDIMTAIHEKLDETLTVDDARNYVLDHKGCLPKEWTLEEALSMTRNLRTILYVCPITDLEYEEATEQGPAFSFNNLEP